MTDFLNSHDSDFLPVTDAELSVRGEDRPRRAPRVPRGLRAPHRARRRAGVARHVRRDRASRRRSRCSSSRRRRRRRGLTHRDAVGCAHGSCAARIPTCDDPGRLALASTSLGGAAGRGDKPALIDGATGAVTTYAELADQVARTAAGLAAEGIGPGDAVGLLGPNTPAWAVAFHAVVALGAIVTLDQPAAHARRGRQAARDRGREGRDRGRAAARRGRRGRGSSGCSRSSRSRRGSGDARRRRRRSGARPRRAAVLERHDRPLEGRDAHPPQPRREHGADPRDPPDRRRRRADRRCCRSSTSTARPSSSTSGSSQGATIVTMPRFDMGAFLDLLERHRVTRAHVAPPVVLGLAKAPGVEGRDLALRVVISGAAPLDADTANRASRAARRARPPGLRDDRGEPGDALRRRRGARPTRTRARSAAWSAAPRAGSSTPRPARTPTATARSGSAVRR